MEYESGLCWQPPSARERMPSGTKAKVRALRPTFIQAARGVTSSNRVPLALPTETRTIAEECRECVALDRAYRRMTPEAVLIAKPDIDFVTFLRLSNQALGYSPARASDKTNRELTDTEKFLSQLAAFRDRAAPVGLAPNLLAHVSFTVLIVADDEDMVQILEMAAGMPWVIANTVKPGVQIAILTGDLADWRDAVKSGAIVAALSSVGQGFRERQAREGVE